MSSTRYETGVKVAVPLLVAAVLSVSGLLWGHESRLTTVEVQSSERAKAFGKDLAEIKDTTRQLLQFHLKNGR